MNNNASGADSPPSITRRRLLLTLLLGLSGVRSAPAGVCVEPSPDGDAGVPGWLGLLREDTGAAARLGSVYLRDHPAERSVRGLLIAVERSCLGLGDVSSNPLTILDRAVREDYRRGELVSVDRWLVSRTEARVYALVTLMDQS